MTKGGENIRIPLAKPYYSKKDVDTVKKVLESGWVAQGPTVEEFEKRFADYIGTQFAIAVNSCTSALHLSLLAFNIGPGDEVIVPDFTFPATGNVVLSTGAKPKLVDIDLKTLNIDSNLIENKISEKTRAIIPVDTFGNPVEMDPILKIAKKYNLKVIEDAACAVGAQYKGKRVGSICDTSSFSFHARKIISTGEGGIITTNDDELGEKLKALRSHGMYLSAWDREQNSFQLPTFEILGFNYRMSDITAAIGITQLKMIDKFIRKRRELAKYYNDLFDDSKIGITLINESRNSKHVYQTYLILLNRDGIRNKVIFELQKKGIGCTIGTYSLSSLPLFQGNCPNGKKAYENSIALPMFFELTENEIDFVVKTLISILGEHQ